jgi:DNA polymerase III epsilon subunit
MPVRLCSQQIGPPTKRAVVKVQLPNQLPVLQQTLPSQQFRPLKPLQLKALKIPPAPAPVPLIPQEKTETAQTKQRLLIEPVPEQVAGSIAGLSRKNHEDASPPPIHLSELPPPPQQEIDLDQKSQEIHMPILPLAKLLAALNRYVVVDTESTGLGKNQALTQIGCVEIENFEITGAQFKANINPECEVGPEAHRITGLTWRFLSHYPTFKRIGPAFMKFIQGATLIFHDASNDLRWLKSSLQFYGYTSHDLDKKEIIDTFQIATKLHPKDKKGLRALCELYGIEAKQNEQHDALADAKLLAQLFCKLVRKDESIVDSTQAKLNLDRLNGIGGTPGEKFFRALGITGELPFYFVSGLYHPESKQNYPSVLIPFMQDGVCKGMLARYLIPFQEEPSTEKEIPKLSKKIFYGRPENAFADIYTGGTKTVFIGNLMSALVARDLLLDPTMHFDVQDFTIKACADLAYLPHFTVSPGVEEVIVLADADIGPAEGKQFLLPVLQYCCSKKIVFKVAIFQDRDEKRHIKKSITELIKKNHLQLVDCLRRTVQIKDKHELDLLFSSKISKWLKELETIRRANDIYRGAQQILPDSPATKYFEKRGLTGQLPNMLRLTRLYHQWLQKELPVIVAPMHNRKGEFTAIHQIFCHEDGSSPPKRADNSETGKRRNKITLGKASGAAIEFTDKGEPLRTEEQYSVAFVGEGLENTLIVAQTMAVMKIVNPTLTKLLYAKFGIFGPFLFQSCLGVNDVKQAPLPKETKTVVILADNDGKKNLEANQAVKDSALFFLASGQRVFVVLPFLPKEKEKWDLNDAYLNATEGAERVVTISNILLEAVEIKRKEELEDPSEAVEDCLKRIIRQRQEIQLPPAYQVVNAPCKHPALSKPVKLSSDQSTENSLQKNLTVLLTDPVFNNYKPQRPPISLLPFATTNQKGEVTPIVATTEV